MDSKELLHKILDKQDETTKELTEIKVIQGRQEEILKEHMRRSLANEEAVELLRNEIKPIQAHVLGVNTTAKLVGFVAVVFGLIASVVKIIQFFK